MKIPFSKQEVGAMVAAAIEEAWEPMQPITDITIHKGANLRHVMTLTSESGCELKLTREAVEAAIVVAFNKDVAPISVKNPKVTAITFHQSDEAMAKVEVISKDVESGFTSSKRG